MALCVSMRYVTCLLIVVAVRGEPDMDGLLKVGKSARKAGEIYAHARFRGVGAASEDVLLVMLTAVSVALAAC